MKLRIPSNLKVDKLTIAYPTSHIKGFDKDYVYYVCNVIYNMMEHLNDKKCYKQSSFEYGVPLYSRTLEKVIGRNYHMILAWMIDAGIIETNGYYKPGSISKLYRFRLKYLHRKFSWKTSSNKRLETIRRKPGSDIYSHKPIYEPRLINQLQRNFQHLQIDKKAAFKWVDKFYRKELSEILTGKPKDREAKIAELQRTCEGYRNSIRKINAKDCVALQDSFGHRLHTPLTNLKKELRPFVTCNGQGLVEIDMKNSQLFLIIPLLDWKLYHKQAGGGKEGTLKHTIWIGERLRRLYSSTIMFCKKLEARYSKGFQVMNFVSDACKGIIYEQVAMQLNKEGFFKADETLPEQRAYVKRYLLKLIFASQKEHRHMYLSKPGEVWKAFKNCYPEVGALMDHLKEVDYKCVSEFLQRTESYCMLRGVCKTIARDKPEVPLFTLHDCIVTTKEYAAYVNAILNRKVTDIIGYKPSTTTKPWVRKKRKVRYEVFYQDGFLLEINHTRAA